MPDIPPISPDSVETVIKRGTGWPRVPVGEIWRYRDLLRQFVRRDYSTRFRQTLLGPLWHILQPVMLTTVFAVVFGRIARLDTDDVPPSLFYMCGLLAWTYFAQTMPAIANTFTANSYLFNKIYFPRLTVPLSVILTNLVSLLLQSLTFAALWFYYRTFSDFGLKPMTPVAQAVGLLVLAQLQIMALSLGLGCLLAAATGKYRDLQHALPVLVQLWFYATPIVYPLSMISREARWHWVATLNPMSAPAEAIKLALVGRGSWTPTLALGAWGLTLAILFLGLSAFARAERTVVDVS